MSALRILYEVEPEFPPGEGMVRYQAGEFWVDAAVGAPQEVDRVLEELGRLVYQRRREARAALAQQVIARAKKH